MAGQTSQNPLFGKMAGRLAEAHYKVKDNEPEVGNAGLPPGIEGGTAQLWDMKFGLFEKGDFVGKPYYMAIGIVQQPVTHAGQKCFGRRTKIGPIPMCDTPKRQSKATFEAHYNDFLDQLKLFDKNAVVAITSKPLGKTQAEKDQRGLEIEQGLIMLMKALTDAKPYFNFRTWRGDKQVSEVENGQWFVWNVKRNDAGEELSRKKAAGPFPSESAMKEKFPYVNSEPLVNEEWNGICDYKPPVAGAGMADGTGGPAPQPNGSAPHAQAQSQGKSPINRLGATAAKKPTPTQTATAPVAAAQPEPTFDEFQHEQQDANGEPEPTSVPDASQEPIDLDSLSLADLVTLTSIEDANKAPAEKKLIELAVSVGLSEEDARNADTWQQVADAIEEQLVAAQGHADDTAGEPEPEPVGPAVGTEVDHVKVNADGTPKVNPINKKPLNPVKCRVESVDAATQTVVLKALNGKETFKDIPWSAVGA